MIMPWQQLFNEGWRIVGMNHYKLIGTSHLFCSMAKDQRCIIAEDTDEAEVFRKLERLAGIVVADQGEETVPLPKIDYDFLLAEIDKERVDVEAKMASERTAGNAVKAAQAEGEFVTFNVLRSWIVRLKEKGEQA